MLSSPAARPAYEGLPAASAVLDAPANDEFRIACFETCEKLVEQTAECEKSIEEERSEVEQECSDNEVDTDDRLVSHDSFAEQDTLDQTQDLQAEGQGQGQGYSGARPDKLVATTPARTCSPIAFVSESGMFKEPLPIIGSQDVFDSSDEETSALSQLGTLMTPAKLLLTEEAYRGHLIKSEDRVRTFKENCYAVFSRLLPSVHEAWQSIVSTEGNQRHGYYLLAISNEQVARTLQRAKEGETDMRDTIESEYFLCMEKLYEQAERCVRSFIAQKRTVEEPETPLNVPLRERLAHLSDPHTSVRVYSQCPFKYKEHCAFINNNVIDQEHLHKVHLTGMEDAPPNTASYVYGKSARRTKLERLQYQFKRRRPIKLCYPEFLYPIHGTEELGVFNVAQEDLSPFGPFKHGGAVKFGKHGRCAELSGRYAHILGTRSGYLWVVAKGDGVAIPVKTESNERVQPEDVTEMFNMWGIEGKIHIVNHATPCTMEIWGNPLDIQKPKKITDQIRSKAVKLTAFQKVKMKMGLISGSLVRGYTDPLEVLRKEINTSIVHEFGLGFLEE